MLLGGIAGGVSAAVNGGNVAKGILVGAAIGGFSGGAAYCTMAAMGAGAMTATSWGGSLISPMETGLITASEYAVGGFGMGLITGYAGGKGSFGDMLGSAAFSGALSFASGFGIGYSYAAGWQDILHGIDAKKFNGRQIKYNSNVNFELGKYNQTEWDEYYALIRQGRTQEATNLLKEIQKKQAMGNWFQKWIPESNASFKPEIYPTNVGKVAHEYCSKLGMPVSALQVEQIVHVTQYGHHEFLGGFIKSDTIRAHWGLGSGDLSWIYGINAGEMGVHYYEKQDP